ncbi:tetratricopeptide repeat protein [Paractinoplanes atraurantiacus]|uniref:Tetratricopeptide repeat-containing protein n=1 Tax=Paractinoplanes atraurantiacus TaxID=1036182 RepID=A0A285F2X8_9ACTN|nr:tetratricopeptide repeat protein [Actinoplanes atraurantiacus]SNY05625.1 Tetratricopeptide repeat-containing protein [Actinoplanes atraurantiacus]
MTLTEQTGLEFGRRLRELRVLAGLTIEGLAEASGVSARAISDMERGRSRTPQPRTVAALSAALGGDTVLGELAKAGRETVTTGRPRMCDLPRRSGHFVGRDDELAAIGKAFEEAASVTVVHGQPGVGKTGLAIRAAELHRELFPDGCFYLDLRGTEPGGGASAGEAQTVLLRALGVSSRQIARGDEERGGQLRAILGQRRCLLILDNAGGEGQVRGLLPGAGSAVVVTSRRVLGGLEAVRRIALAPLPAPAAVELLGGGGGNDGEIARLCGYLPLALRIAANLHDPDRLSDADRRLEMLTPVEAAFAASYAQLPETARTVFRRLAHVPTLSFSAAAAAVVAELDRYDAEDVLEKLLDRGLLQPEGHDRYRFHDLIRLFARARLRAEEPAAVRRRGEKRLIDWYLDTAIASGRVFEPAYGSAPEQWDPAQAWLQAEVDGWFGAMRRAAAAGEHQRVVDVAESLHWYSDRTYSVDPWSAVFTLSRESAERLADRRQEVVHRNYQAWAMSFCDGRYPETVEQAMAAYAMAVELDDRKEQAAALIYAADAYAQMGERGKALELMRRSLELADTVGDHDGYVQTLIGIGATLSGMGRAEEAAEQYRHALQEAARRPLAPAPEFAARVAASVFLTHEYARMERWNETVDAGREALPLAEKFGEPHLLGRTHLALGLAHRARGDHAAARAAFAEAVGQFRRSQVTTEWSAQAEVLHNVPHGPGDGPLFA